MLRFGPGGLQILFDFGHDLGILPSHILLLAEVGAEVIKLERRAGLRAHGFPIAHPHGLLKAALVEFPIEEFVAVGFGPCPAAPATWTCRRGSGGTLASRNFSRGRQEIPERPRLVVHRAGFDLPGPAHDQRHRECRPRIDRA